MTLFIVENYSLALVLCVITMLCWGSWANTQKLASKEWRFQLFYWDYALGVLLLSLVLAFTIGSSGDHGRSFVVDLSQARSQWLLSAFIGGVIFNLSNILLVAAIDIAGMAVAFPVGVGLALVLGVITTYLAKPMGNVPLLMVGVLGVTVAIILDALAYRRLLTGGNRTPVKGIVIAVVAGLLMGLFYSFVAKSMGAIDPVLKTIEAGKLSPYTAVVLFSVGLLLSTFLWNSIMMVRPLVGAPVPFVDYFTKGNAPTARRGDPGRRDLEHGHGSEHSCQQRRRSGAFLWAGPVRDAHRGIVGRLHLEGIQKRTARNQQTVGFDVPVLRAGPGRADCIEDLSALRGH